MKTMKQQEIFFQEVVDLGFKVTREDDEKVYSETGGKYIYACLKLTKKVDIYWNNISMNCEIIRIDNRDNESVLNRRVISDFKILKSIVSFFKEDQQN
jgi:hypothetical protein